MAGENTDRFWFEATTGSGMAPSGRAERQYDCAGSYGRGVEHLYFCRELRCGCRIELVLERCWTTHVKSAGDGLVSQTTAPPADCPLSLEYRRSVEPYQRR